MLSSSSATSLLGGLPRGAPPVLSPAALIALTLGYLATLFVVARLGDRWAPARALSRRPLVAALALGAYATSWSYFGSVGFAAREGWRYLAIYIGVTASCAAVPVLWARLHGLVRARQLTSLADLFAYRYQSRGTGVVVAAFLLVGSLPYQALQLRALVASVAELGGEVPVDLGLLISLGLIAFGVLYGARHVSLRERHDGMVLAVALESVIKLVVLVVFAWTMMNRVFPGLGGLHAWLASSPGELRAMATPARDGDWVALLLLSAGAGFLLPRQWHLAFTENADPRVLTTASWALPAYLLILTLAVPLILWTGRAVGLEGDPDFYVLGLARASESPFLAAAVFLGALAAGTAMILVTTVALAAMAQNHLVVPAVGWARRGNLYRRLRWLRRGLIAAIILGGYAVYLGLRRRTGLADLGLVSFVAIAQLAPGLVGVMFWPRATARGVLAGLAVGAGLWAVTLLVPLFGVDLDVLGMLGLRGDLWSVTSALSVGANLLAFVAVSLAGSQRAVEADAAATCARRPGAEAGGVSTSTAEELARRLAGVLGPAAAERELERALTDLGLPRAERRPMELRRLRDRLEHNLSGLLGPLPARAAVDDALPLDRGQELVLAQLRFVAEHRAAAEAPARELDAARRYLLRVLGDLPIGVATLGPAGEVVVWNPAMAAITRVSAELAVGVPVSTLPPPWGEVLSAFVEGGAARDEVVVPGSRTIALGRSELGPGALLGPVGGGVILLVEDRTEQRALEAQVMHQDRLASIGRLAAGVAHEVGNPLTGIKLVADNLRREAIDAEQPDLADRLGTIVSATGRIDRIVRALVGYAHAGAATSGVRGPVDVAAVVADAITLTRLTRAGKALTITSEVPAGLEARGDAQRLEQVVLNLLANACDASSEGGVVEVVVRHGREPGATTERAGGAGAPDEDGGPAGDPASAPALGSAPGAMLELLVIDHGTGMTADVAARALEPFFTTKAPGAGTGLGLALVYSIVVDHGGTIAIETQSGVGTTIRVTLPS